MTIDLKQLEAELLYSRLPCETVIFEAARAYLAQQKAPEQDDKNALTLQYIENGKQRYCATTDVMYLEVSLDTYNEIKAALTQRPAAIDK